MLLPKNFLITLLRPELANAMDFYLLDSVDADEIKNALADNPATSFDITGSYDTAYGIFIGLDLIAALLLLSLKKY